MTGTEVGAAIRQGGGGTKSRQEQPLKGFRKPLAPRNEAAYAWCVCAEPKSLFHMPPVSPDVDLSSKASSTNRLSSLEARLLFPQGSSAGEMSTLAKPSALQG